MTVKGKENELLAEANKIQEELKEVIKTYNKTTSRHNIVIWVLTGIIALSAIATLYCNFVLNKTGRYAFALSGSNEIFVLDTKTSQLWTRYERNSIYLGTNKNPRPATIKHKK